MSQLSKTETNEKQVRNCSSAQRRERESPSFLIPALRSQRQVDPCELRVSLVYTEF